MSPVVTIGIPFHNEARYLREAIASIVGQTFTRIEVLLVDDGSSDGSLAIAAAFANDPRVRVISDGVRRGLPARLNQIVTLARGGFIARMDGDDISHPERIARQLALFDADASLHVVGSWIALIDHDKKPLAISEYSRSERSLSHALRRGLLPHATTLGRAEWFRAHPYDEALTRAEDRDLWCRCARSLRFDLVPLPLYLVRVFPRARDFLDEYWTSQRQNRILFRRYGRDAIGIVRATSGVLSTYAKSIAMSAAVRAGVAERLIRRRGRSPSTAERALIREALAAVSA